MNPTDSLPIDRTDDGSGQHWCHNCMPSHLDPRLEGFYWDHGDRDHRHIIKDGKITIPPDWILHSWVHGDHIHLIWPDSPGKPFDGKIEGADSYCLTQTLSETESKPEDKTEQGYQEIARKKLENTYFEERRKQKENESIIAESIKKVIDTNKEILQSDNLKFDFHCYVPDCKFGTNKKSDYETHVITTHKTGTLCYPGLVDLKERDWKPQWKPWEI